MHQPQLHNEELTLSTWGCACLKKKALNEVRVKWKHLAQQLSYCLGTHPAPNSIPWCEYRKCLSICHPVSSSRLQPGWSEPTTGRSLFLCLLIYQINKGNYIFSEGGQRSGLQSSLTGMCARGGYFKCWGAWRKNVMWAWRWPSINQRKKVVEEAIAATTLSIFSL